MNVWTSSTWSKTKRVVDSDSEEDKLGKKKRRRIKKPEPDSSDEDGELFIWFYFMFIKSALCEVTESYEMNLSQVDETPP